jgi:heat-inducible transcriptional repressor
MTSQNTGDNGSGNAPNLSERAQTLLKILIEKYIDEGQPIGSKFLATHSGLDLSSATIRNVLADLEDMGLITSPHTSAGRVPTDLGYRMFVENLVTVKPLNRRIIKDLESHFSKDANQQQLLTMANDMLSEVTSMASVVMLPRREHKSLRQVEFLPLSEKRVLAITIINECEVENRVLHTKRDYTRDELQQIANVLNSGFSGRDVVEVRKNLLNDLKRARQDVNELMTSVVDVADRLFEDTGTEDFVISGQGNLLAFQEMADIERLKQLFDAFKQKRDILEILDQCLLAQRMQIFIGSESGYDAFNQCSLITSPYEVEGETLGVLGVIGPTRMAYEKVIPIVDVTAKLLGSALKLKS